MEFSSAAVAPLWEKAFPEIARPELYTGTQTNEYMMRPLNDPQNFMSDLTTMSQDKLYINSANLQLAMNEAQHEYLENEAEIAYLEGRKVRKNPRILPDEQVFEERKEAQLYGYKYEANRPMVFTRALDDVSEREKHDVQQAQDPFLQGGFVPNKRQYEAKKAKAKDPRNIDDWKPIEKDGKKLIPRLQQHHPEYPKLQLWTLDGTETVRATRMGSDESFGATTPSKAVNKRLTRTRFDGQKVPPTRDASEAPSGAASPRGGRSGTPRAANFRQMTPLTPGTDDSPVPRKRQKVSIPSQSRGPSRPNSTMPIGPMSPNSMRQRKWNTDDLVESVKADHSWLNPDPAKALEWKNKIIAGQNPVRTWSMLKKWGEWQDKGADKRPRNKDGASKRAVERSRKMGLATPEVNGVGLRSQIPRASMSRKNSAATMETGWGSRDSLANSEFRMSTEDDQYQDETEEEKDLVQQQVDQQLLRPLVEAAKAEEEQDYKPSRGTRMDLSPSTPVRRSMRSLKGST